LRENTLRASVNERVRLLQLLTHTPHGTGLTRALRKSLRKTREANRSARNAKR
jgi:hypothetical protein